MRESKKANKTKKAKVISLSIKKGEKSREYESMKTLEFPLSSSFQARE